MKKGILFSLGIAAIVAGSSAFASGAAPAVDPRWSVHQGAFVGPYGGVGVRYWLSRRIAVHALVSDEYSVYKITSNIETTDNFVSCLAGFSFFIK